MAKSFDLSDRLNWRQACTVHGCEKSTLYRLVKSEDIIAYGAGDRCRWYSKEECLNHLNEKRVLDNE